MGISDDIIRAAVQAGQYSNPRAEQFLIDALIERRDKIGRVWLTAINPVVDPALGGGRFADVPKCRCRLQLRRPRQTRTW